MVGVYWKDVLLLISNLYLLGTTQKWLFPMNPYEIQPENIFAKCIRLFLAITFSPIYLPLMALCNLWLGFKFLWYIPFPFIKINDWLMETKNFDPSDLTSLNSDIIYEIKQPFFDLRKFIKGKHEETENDRIEELLFEDHFQKILLLLSTKCGVKEWRIEVIKESMSKADVIRLYDKRCMRCNSIDHFICTEHDSNFKIYR